MVGGLRETFDACLPIFQLMGVKIVYAGAERHGLDAQVGEQPHPRCNYPRRRRGARPGDKAGLDPQTVIDITSSAGPHGRDGDARPRMVERDFRPHFSVTTCTRTYPMR